VDLAEIIRAAIADSAPLINSAAAKWPDRPIQIELSWMPGMQKLDLVLKTVDHMPSWHPKKQGASAPGDD
jgi:hypothetical protein